MTTFLARFSLNYYHKPIPVKCSEIFININDIPRQFTTDSFLKCDFSVTAVPNNTTRYMHWGIYCSWQVIYVYLLSVFNFVYHRENYIKYS